MTEENIILENEDYEEQECEELEENEVDLILIREDDNTIVELDVPDDKEE